MSRGIAVVQYEICWYEYFAMFLFFTFRFCDASLATLVNVRAIVNRRVGLFNSQATGPVYAIPSVPDVTTNGSNGTGE